jgi:DNA polymerase-3 subunit gamma/tau
MSYTVLARKYRPETFNDVVGQDWISRTLTNAIEKGRIAHAFLFSGPRGVGKTSMARILSKALNCEKGPTPDPCLQCEHCLSISRGGGVDVVEIDAASNRGIDHIRALRENVRYVPVNSRHKIYIIDEVHMLTTESFNALLKTLEEPPEHVKFIFATTEQQKMPETVRSRCQCYDFRRITSSDIEARLEYIAKQERIACEPGVLQRIAVLARGGLRDAESLLDQIAALGKGQASYSALNALTGRLSPDEVGDLVDAVLEEDTEKILAFVDRVFSSGTQGEDLLKDLIDYWRALLRIAAGSEDDLSEVLPGLEERGAEQVQHTDLDTILASLQIAMETLKKARWFDDERILTEMALLKMARLSHSLSITDSLASLAKGEPSDPRQTPPTGGAPGPGRGSSSGGREQGGSAAPKKSSPPPKGVAGKPKGSGQNPAMVRILNPAETFKRLIDEVETSSRSLGAYLRKVKCTSIKGKVIELQDTVSGAGGLFSLESQEVKQKLSDAAQTALGGDFEFRFLVRHGGADEIPAHVRKTMERFEGELL